MSSLQHTHTTQSSLFESAVHFTFVKTEMKCKKTGKKGAEEQRDGKTCTAECRGSEGKGSGAEILMRKRMRAEGEWKDLLLSGYLCSCIMH